MEEERKARLERAFSMWWDFYPRKIAKKKAHDAWFKFVKQTTPEEIQKRTLHFVRGEWRGRDEKYIPYPATFLNSEDWTERTELVEDEAEPGKPLDLHLCEVCEPAHEWKGRVDLPYKATCPKQVGAMQMAISSARLKGI